MHKYTALQVRQAPPEQPGRRGQSVRELEEHYRVLLFERLSKKLYITEAWKTFYSYAKQVVFQFDQLEEHMFRDLKERLRIGATVTVGSRALPEIVREFRL